MYFTNSATYNSWSQLSKQTVKICKEKREREWPPMRFFTIQLPNEEEGTGTQASSALDANISGIHYSTAFEEDLSLQSHQLPLMRPLGLGALALGTLFCICANLLTLFLLLRCRPLQRSSRTTNIYVLSLSLADLGVGGVAMPLMLIHEWHDSSLLRYPAWLCQAWQLADLLFSTVSLYSICAIALDRVWNLEQPLRVFTRSRRRAKRLVLCIWALPLLLWLPAYLLLLPSGAEVAGQQQSCFAPSWVAKRVYWIALPALYVPSAVLICLFLRISFVVHRHLKFLREHSSVSQQQPQPVGASPCQNHQNNGIAHANGQCTPQRSPSAPPMPSGQAPYQQRLLLRSTTGSASPKLQKQFSNSQTVKPLESFSLTGHAGGACGTFSRSPKSPNLLLKSGGQTTIWRERGHTASAEEFQQWRNSPTILVHVEQEEAAEMTTKSGGKGWPASVEQQQNPAAESIGHKLSLASRPSTGGGGIGIPSSPTASESSSLSGKSDCLLRKLSASFLTRRGSSTRFSMMAFSENLAELLQREGVAQQVKAAKAVGLILCCFLVCWFPFLLVWPIRLFSPQTVSDRTFRLCLWLNYGCSTLNPLLYALSNPKVRSALRNYVLGCRWLKREGSAKNTRRSNTGVFV